MDKKEDLSKRKYMTDCDIVLMIPGRLDCEGAEPKALPVKTSTAAAMLIDAIKENVEIEMSEAAQDTIARYNLGTADLVFRPDMDMPRKDTIVWENKGASCMLAFHKSTKLCVLEIYIPDSDDGVQMLECYGNDEVLIRPEGSDKYVYVQDFLEELGITVTGLKRSAVFAYGEPSAQECAHCLANELTPHDGDVTGVLLEKISKSNRTQYSGSDTYASATTLLEVLTELGKDPLLENRIKYQTSEIYFVEHILLRDASATNIANRLAELSKSYKGKNAKEAKAIKEKLTKIDAALGMSAVLYDVSLFKWATVHEEIKLLSKDLGVPEIIERNRNNKAILESFQRAIEAREKEKSEKLKNGFLLAITGMTLINTVHTALTTIGTKDLKYDISLLIVLCAYIVYSVIKKKKY